MAKMFTTTDQDFFEDSLLNTLSTKKSTEIFCLSAWVLPKPRNSEKAIIMHENEILPGTALLSVCRNITSTTIMRTRNNQPIAEIAEPMAVKISTKR